MISAHSGAVSSPNDNQRHTEGKKKKKKKEKETEDTRDTILDSIQEANATSTRALSEKKKKNEHKIEKLWMM